MCGSKRRSTFAFLQYCLHFLLLACLPSDKWMLFLLSLFDSSMERHRNRRVKVCYTLDSQRLLLVCWGEKRPHFSTFVGTPACATYKFQSCAKGCVLQIPKSFLKVSKCQLFRLPKSKSQGKVILLLYYTNLLNKMHTLHYFSCLVQLKVFHKNDICFHWKNASRFALY